MAGGVRRARPHCSPSVDGIEHLIVAGMGGSAIGADLARAALGDRLTKPMTTVRGYELPPWVTPSSVVAVRELLRQHRGDACLLRGRRCARGDARGGHHRRPAGRGGARGRRAGDPAARRAAAARGRRLHDGARRSRSRRSRASRRACGPRSTRPPPGSSAWPRSGGRTPTPTASRSASPSGSTARACACTAPVRPAPSRPGGRRQLNENAKIPAFAAELPEADHNEIVGWQDAAALGSFTAVFLEDVDQHPRVRQRVELTAALIEQQAAGTLRLESVGSNPVERLLSLVLLGDLVSDLPRCPARHRPHPGGADRAPEGRAGARRGRLRRLQAASVYFAALGAADAAPSEVPFCSAFACCPSI